MRQRVLWIGLSKVSDGDEWLSGSFKPWVFPVRDVLLADMSLVPGLCFSFFAIIHCHI